MIMSQLRRVTENSGVHKQCGMVLSGITTQQLTVHRKKNIKSQGYWISSEKRKNLLNHHLLPELSDMPNRSVAQFQFYAFADLTHTQKKVLFICQSGMEVIRISYVNMFQHETFHTTGTKTEEFLLEND